MKCLKGILRVSPLSDSGTYTVAVSCLDDFGSIFPISQFDSKITTFSTLVVDVDVDARSVCVLLATISTPEIGAVPSFAISIITLLDFKDVRNGSSARTFITLSPVTLKSKSAKAVLTPDSLNLE